MSEDDAFLFRHFKWTSEKVMYAPPKHIKHLTESTSKISQRLLLGISDLGVVSFTVGLCVSFSLADII